MMDQYKIVFLNKKSKKFTVQLYASSEQEAMESFRSNSKYKGCIVLGIMRSN